MTGSQIRRPPSGLGARGRALWRQIQQNYELDAVENELLHELCRVADRCDEIQAELKGQPLTTSGSVGQPRVNPLLSALREEQKMLDRLAGSLGVSMPGAAGAGKTRGHQTKAGRTRWSRATKAVPGSVTPIRGGA